MKAVAEIVGFILALLVVSTLFTLAIKWVVERDQAARGASLREQFRGCEYLGTRQQGGWGACRLVVRYQSGTAIEEVCR